MPAQAQPFDFNPIHWPKRALDGDERVYTFLFIALIFVAVMLAVAPFAIMIERHHAKVCHDRGLDPGSVTGMHGKFPQTTRFCVDKDRRVYWIE